MAFQSEYTYRDYGVSFYDVPPDVVVRSAEGAYFLAHKQLLALSSPFFATFPYGIDGQLNEARGDLPVIPFVAESTSTVECILRLCYPHAPQVQLSLMEMRNVWEASLKYDIAGVKTWIERELRKHSKEEALNVYALAISFKLHDVAKEAARDYLTRERRAWSNTLLECVSGADYDTLLHYRERCADAICGTSLMVFIQSIMRVATSQGHFSCSRCILSNSQVDVTPIVSNRYVVLS